MLIWQAYKESEFRVVLFFFHIFGVFGLKELTAKPASASHTVVSVPLLEWDDTHTGDFYWNFFPGNAFKSDNGWKVLLNMDSRKKNMPLNVPFFLNITLSCRFLPVAEFLPFFFHPLWPRHWSQAFLCYFTFHQQAAFTGSTSVMEICAEGNGMKWNMCSNIFTCETGLI